MDKCTTTMWSDSANLPGGLHTLQRVHRDRNARARAFLRGGRASSRWRPGADARAVRHPAAAGSQRVISAVEPVVVAGGGIAGIAAAVG
jgi:hypothetical protein